MGTELLRFRDEERWEKALEARRSTLEEGTNGTLETSSQPGTGLRVPLSRGRAREIAQFRERWGEAEADAQFASHCQGLYARFNARYFDGVLTPVDIGVGDGYQTLDEVGYQYYGRYLRASGRAAKRGAGAAIQLDYSLGLRPRKLRLVLLHEMLHHYEHVSRRDPSRSYAELDEPIDTPPYLGAALELAFLLKDDPDVRRWIAIELGLPCGPNDDDRIRFYLRGHSHRFVIAAYNLARLDHRNHRWYYA